ncbi:DNA repair and recombination protein RAD52, partial [Tremellales sp. Uapishka_1]
MSLASHLVNEYGGHPSPQPHSTFQGARSNNEPWMNQHGTGGQGGRFTQWSEEKVASLQARLSRKLGPEYITQRAGPGGGPKLSYIEGWKVINLANEVFGFNGWSTQIVSLTTNFIDVNKDGRCSVNVTAIVRITLQDGCFHEDVGCGGAENLKQKGAALDKAQKEAVTDATKRALKTFGSVLGGCLYDKEFTKAIGNVKSIPYKLNVETLERRPEFVPPTPPHPPSAVPSHMTNHPRPPAPSTAEGSKTTYAPTPGTPLRSVNDPEESLIDDCFDPEFMDLEGESYLGEVDMSMYDSGSVKSSMASTSRTMLPPRNPIPEKPPQPAYVHRHRPDVPAEPSLVPQAQPQPPPPNKPQPPRPPPTTVTASATTTNTESRTFSRSMSDGSNPVGSSSGSSIEGDRSKVKQVGGFVYPNREVKPITVQNSAQAARARAIAMSVATSKDGPLIPNGGIDHVVAESFGNIPSESERWDLDMNGKNNYGGFGSARGIKRTSGDPP